MTHRKVQCWILSKQDNETQCLLLKTNQARGRFWQPVTGTVEEGEGFFEAACREPLEETGFSFISPPVDTGYEFEFDSRFGHTKERTYALMVEGLPKPKLDPKEHEDYQWADPQKALALLRFASNAEGLKRALKIVFGEVLQESQK